MATVRYTGNAVRRKQVDTYTVASPTSGASTYTVVCNGKTFTYVAASNVAADVAAALVAAYQAQTNILELLDAVADVNGAIVTFTSIQDGYPFTFTESVSGGGTWSGSTTTTNSGSGVFDLADNWSAAISSSDDLVIEKPNTDIQFRLTSLTTSLTSFTIRGTFTGQLGLPIQNSADYPEYRGCYAKLVCPLYIIGIGEGNGPSRCYIESNAGAAASVVVHKTGSSNDSYPACMLKHTSGGSNSFSSIRVVDGDVGIALLAGEVATVTLLTVGDNGTTPTVSAGVGATIATATINGGEVHLVTTPATALTINGGASVYITNGGGSTAVSVLDGSLELGGTGSSLTLTDLTIGSNGTLDLSHGQGTVNVTNGIKMYTGATLIDPLNRLASSTVINPQQCTIDDLNLTTAKGITWTKS